MKGGLQHGIFPRLKKVVIASVVNLAMFGLNKPVCAGPLLEYITRIENPKGVNGPRDAFGYSVAFVGENLLVGANLADGVSLEEGAAYLFSPDGELLHSFTNPQGRQDGQFGEVLLGWENDVVIAGIRNDVEGVETGVVYVYDQQGNLKQEIPDPRPGRLNFFGRNMVIVGDKLAIGSTGQSPTSERIGSVYLFDRSGQLVNTIENPYPEDLINFGIELKEYGGQLLINALGKPGGNAFGGGMSLLYNVNREIVQEFHNPSGNYDNAFGHFGAEIDDRYVYLSASRDDTYALDSGVVFVFDRTTGEMIREIPNPTPGIMDWFGRDDLVLIGPNILAVGAPFDSDAAFQAGTVSLFDLDGTLIETLQNPTPANVETFGGTLAVSSNGILAVAARFDGGNGFDSPGAVYLYRVTPEPESLAVLCLLFASLAVYGFRSRMT